MQTMGWEMIPDEAPFWEGDQTEPVRVLLADDDEDLRLLLAAALREDGYLVIEAATGEQLIDLVAAQLMGAGEDGGERGGGSGDLGRGVVDVIISDILMPGPNGLWALATLRHLDWATPFVVITALEDEGTRRQARRLGAAAFLRKPIDLRQFRATVANLAGPALPEALPGPKVAQLPPVRERAAVLSSGPFRRAGRIQVMRHPRREQARRRSGDLRHAGFGRSGLRSGGFSGARVSRM
jgi:CheY-like chemotaxis protein